MQTVSNRRPAADNWMTAGTAEPVLTDRLLGDVLLGDVPHKSRPASLGWLCIAALSFGAIGCGADPTQPGVITTDAAFTDGGATDGSPTDSGGAATDAEGADAAGVDDGGAGLDAGAADGGGAADAGPTTCADDSVCDDKLTCTEDLCAQPGEVCAWTLKADFCLIGKVCYAAGAANTNAPCQVCDPALSTTAWSTAKDGVACEDGASCTVDGACEAGGCVGKPLVCGDGNPCTDDICKQGKGCVYPAVGAASSVTCSDDSACTENDDCVEGSCLGEAMACDDKKGCTVDACDVKTGCTHTNSEAACSDGDACTADDVCAGGACKSGGKANCDDGNACTIDLCKPAAGCVHLPTQSPCCTGQTSICDDGNPCTTDLCDPKTSGCSKAFNTAVCSDDDACTDKDTCAAGKCVGKVSTCDDKNSCTSDACDKSKGCVHAATNDGKACDDGDACSKKDTCQGGKCAGTGGCACTPTFSPTAAKVVDLKIGKGAAVGEGLDLDNNPKTCAPKSSCTGGIDNALGALAGLVNGQLDKPVASGSIMLLVEFLGFKQGPVEVAIHQGQLDPSNKTCDHQKQTCKYWADTSLIDPVTCAPKASLKGTLVGSKLTAGGKGTNFPFVLPLQDGVNLNLTLYDLQLVGTVTTTNGKLTGMTAILGGAVLKSDLEKAIDALPEEGLPIPKATIKALLASTVDIDIDIDGDGKPEASSIALKLKAIPAIITGAK